MATALSTIGACILAVALFPSALGATTRHALRPGRFPEEAARFLGSQAVAGNLFNHFNWGGYLAWQLYPDYRVFTDGRALNLEALSHYTYILWDRSVSPRLLRHYDIRIVVMPERNPFSGERYELMSMLRSDRRWRIVFEDAVATVFVRQGDTDGILDES